MPTTDEEKLVISLEARLSKYEREMKRATQISSQTARKIEGDFSRLDRSMGRMGAGIKSFGAGFIGGLSAQALGRIIVDAAKAGAAIGDLAEQTGMAVEKIQILQHAANQTGSSAEQMSEALKKFALETAKAATEGGDLKDVLDANGVAIKGNANLFEDYLRLIRDAPSDIERLRLVTLGFGRGNDELLNTLRQGPSVLQEYGDSLDRIGGPASQKTIDALGRLDDKFASTMTGIKTATLSMVGVVEPLISGVADEVLQFVRQLEDMFETLKLFTSGEFGAALRLGIMGDNPLRPHLVELAQTQNALTAAQHALELQEIAGKNTIGHQIDVIRLLEKEEAIRERIRRLTVGGGSVTGPGGMFSGGGPVTVMPQAPDEKAAAKAVADVEGELRQMQATLANTRKLPLNDELREALEYAAKINKLIIEVTSGGQVAKGTPGKRTGSVRHDLGRAADIRIRDPITGQLLDASNPADLERINQLIETLASAGLTGFGGPSAGYMGTTKVHVGYGTPATWGGMPMSTQAAIARGGANPVYVAGVEGSRLAAEQDVADAIVKQNDALVAQKELINQLQWDRYLEERATAIEAQVAQLDAMRDLASDVFGGIVADIRAGASAAEIFANVLDKLISKLADMAVNMLVSSLFGPGGTAIPGLLGGLIPGRASGGPVDAGSAYVVGERQPELFVPNVSGRIMPSVPRGIGAASTSIINGQLRGVIDINPSPLLLTSVATTSARMIAENNRRMPAYLADRQRRGV